MERAEKKGSGHTEVAPFRAILSTVQIPCGVGVQGKIRRMSRQILIVALCADHSPVITAQPQRRQVQPTARLTAGPLQIGPDAAVGRHLLLEERFAILLLNAECFTECAVFH